MGCVRTHAGKPRGRQSCMRVETRGPRQSSLPHGRPVLIHGGCRHATVGAHIPVHRPIWQRHDASGRIPARLVRPGTSLGRRVSHTHPPRHRRRGYRRDRSAGNRGVARADAAVDRRPLRDRLGGSVFPDDRGCRKSASIWVCTSAISPDHDRSRAQTHLEALAETMTEAASARRAGTITADQYTRAWRNVFGEVTLLSLQRNG